MSYTINFLASIVHIPVQFTRGVSSLPVTPSNPVDAFLPTALKKYSEYFARKHRSMRNDTLRHPWVNSRHYMYTYCFAIQNYTFKFDQSGHGGQVSLVCCTYGLQSRNPTQNPSYLTLMSYVAV